MVKISIVVMVVACITFANLIINEINSSPNSNNCEWIEIYNNGDSTIYLDSLYLCNGNSEAVVSDGKITINGNQFLVLVQDSIKFFKNYRSSVNTIISRKWVAIYNDGGSVIIGDNRGEIDSVYYDNSWFDKLGNRSINRINLEGATEINDWEIAETSTPGYPNSRASSSGGGLSVSPFPFTPDNDGVDDYLLVSIGNSSMDDFIIIIVGLNGEVYKEYSGAGVGEYRWNGYREDGSRASIGPFYVIARVGDKEYRSKGLLWRN